MQTLDWKPGTTNNRSTNIYICIVGVDLDSGKKREKINFCRIWNLDIQTGSITSSKLFQDTDPVNIGDRQKVI